MKHFLYQTLYKLLKLSKPLTQIRFAMKILDGYLRSVNSKEGYRLRRRLLDKYSKSYPTQYSHEATRIFGFYELISTLQEVEGDIVECGVGRGRFFTVFCFANRFFGLNRKVYGFDSFEGFPVASEQDFGTRVKKKEKISGWDNVQPDMIYDVLEQDIDGEGSKTLFEGGFDASSILLVKGYFQDTLATNLPAKICFLHLDADLYQSTIDALTHCLPKMSPGSVIVFDELHETEKWPGVKQAVDEICVPQNLHPQWNSALQRFVIKIPSH